MRRMTKYVLVFSILLCFACQTLTAQKISSKEIDEIVNNTVKTFNVPGVAVAVIKDGKLIHAKGYGLRSIEGKKKVDENTLFAIASNSKAFTSAALAILVDNGKLAWNDRVIKYIPEFRMYNSYVTEQFTIRDLLTHRSGLGLGAGDLMVFPHINDFTVDDIIHNLRYLKPVSGFRTKYDYDNLLYIVAGEVVKRVSGISWAEFVETNIMKPLDMNSSAGNYTRLKDTTNIATPHMPLGDKLVASARCYSVPMNPAGGIYTNINDLSKWVMTQLNKGKYNDKQLFSERRNREMWAPQTIKRAWSMPEYKSNFNAYALGWEVSDQNGYKKVSHTGGLPGMVTQVTMLPELNLGVIVLTNQQSGLAFMAITDMIKDRYLNINKVDRVKMYKSFEGKRDARADEITAKIWKAAEGNKKIGDVKPFEGMFTDKWWGDITITNKDGKLYFQSVRSPLMHGEMIFYKANTFVVKWADRTMNADAFAMFNLNENGKAVGFKMKAISPATDFSFDFHYLDFFRK